MLISLKEILKIADERGCAIPAFNVYNLETVMGVMQAADELKSPVILQMYSRLFDMPDARLAAPMILEAARMLNVPAVFHLDHGAGSPEVMRAIRYGATGVMIDASAYPLDKNIELTRQTVDLCTFSDIPVEGELGHVGSTADLQMSQYTDPEEAAHYVRETGVAALAVMVGTAHGRYKKAPVLDIDRIADIKAATGIPLVLHGGSGVPDDQICASIKAGIRKINFGTDLCYSFLDGVFATPRTTVAIDLFMRNATNEVKRFAMEKIKLLGANTNV